MAKTSLGRRQQSANAMKQTTNYFAVLSLLDNDADNEEAANPAVPPERGSPLSDGLPAELRTQIFKYVLQAKYSVVNVGHLPPYKRGKKFNTALFTVSREISQEAQEAFYLQNTVRVKSLNDPYTSRRGIRYLELVGAVAQRIIMWNVPTTIHGHDYDSLVELRTATLAVDYCYDQPVVQRRPVQTPHPSDTEEGGPSLEVFGHFVDLGVRRVGAPAVKPQWFMKRFRLVDAVRHARSHHDYGTELVQLAYNAIMPERGTSHGINARFSWWLGRLEFMRDRLAGKQNLQDADEELANGSILPEQRLEIEGLLRKIPQGPRLLDLTAHEHGEEALAAADVLVGAINLHPQHY